jgi:hypothetical protein
MDVVPIHPCHGIKMVQIVLPVDPANLDVALMVLPPNRLQVVLRLPHPIAAHPNMDVALMAHP